jgi:SAM-dependent methyltransferase
MTRHLDLGCGGVPRNPYHRNELFGIDLRVEPARANFKAANLAIDPIPFPDSFFDSVSAYDFLEHVPRILATADGRSTRAPFVELMNEIWRVLVPGGQFYASTPAYPHHAAFQDPTHVNIITTDTHDYFVRPTLTARMYGFVGDFEMHRVLRVKPMHDYQPEVASFAERVRQRSRERRGACSHLVWEFKACK